ncbi:PadR family transcriptional regulator [Streptomyces noursei]|uniref:PadR family transcriptional regulator n=1 Tax=Streptomyces noursei TaxID=1971 RepID=UPI00081C5746|nr:transcriptional regulator [Streptomyces noursei ATCC 11455]MCZ0992169.1 PadR family transcriptional regulator [Streptomyces noursei]
MLDLAIMGFLAEAPLHGYELRTRVAQLTGHVRPVSDGSLYPAINRLERHGCVTRHVEQGPKGSVRRRHTLSLTSQGKDQLLGQLRNPGEKFITDRNRFNVVLAFLGLVPDVREQAAVLQRRREFLDQPASYFTRGGKLVRAADTPDRYRKGMLQISRESRRVEIAWLDSTLAELSAEASDV